MKKAGDIGLTQRREDAKRTGIQGFVMRSDGGVFGWFFSTVALRLGVLSDSGREDRF